MTRRIAAGMSLALAILVAGDAASARPCPNVMLVLDASGSMLQDPFGRYSNEPGFQGQTKWRMLQDVVSECVQQFGERAPFGLMIYSGGGSDDVTCANNCKVQVPVAADSSGAILKLLRETVPVMEAQTPTNGAIHVARAQDALHDAKAAGQYIVLITDGDPNCGSDKRYSDPNTHVIEADVAQYPGTVLGELDKAFHQVPPIRTFVVGFDGDPNGVNTRNLENMGFFGGDKKMGCGSGDTHCYFKTGDNSTDFKRTIRDLLTTLIGEIGVDCDNSCYSTGCPSGEVCTTDESNTAPHCVPDPCMGAKCTGDTFCRLGKCVKACSDGCPGGTTCQDGTCVNDLCAAVTCKAGQVCDPKSGGCITSPCADCPAGAYCDVAAGKCLTDQCRIITCPSGTACVDHGECQADGGGGCHCSVPAAGGHSEGVANRVFDGLPVLGVIAFLARRRRRKG